MPESAKHPANCECLYCQHNHERQCDCDPCVYIRRNWGDLRHIDGTIVP